mmetsp:Transcript_40736/g.75409  ORF Transcript_40736/g.75409 Transcript_40736/m.75409 type:complete len:102 (-) Transcript_40736:7-312(-)
MRSVAMSRCVTKTTSAPQNCNNCSFAFSICTGRQEAHLQKERVELFVFARAERDGIGRTESVEGTQNGNTALQKHLYKAPTSSTSEPHLQMQFHRCPPVIR